MSLFEKLLVASQVSFNNGTVEMFKKRVVIYSTDCIGEYVMTMNEEAKLTTMVYGLAKQAMAKTFGLKATRPSASTEDYLRWFLEMISLSGWGAVEWEGKDLNNRKGSILIRNSAIGTYNKGKVKSQCDHIVRGFLAGGISSAFNVDVDVIETDCMGTGAERCRFVFDSKDNLVRDFPELASKQLER